MSGRKTFHCRAPPPLLPSAEVARELERLERARREAVRRARIEAAQRTIAAFAERRRWIADALGQVGPAIEALRGRVVSALEEALTSEEPPRDAQPRLRQALAEERRAAPAAWVGTGAEAGRAADAVTEAIRSITERFEPWLSNARLPFGRRLQRLAAEAGALGSLSEARRLAEAAALRGRLLDLHYDLEEIELGWAVDHGLGAGAVAGLRALIEESRSVPALDNAGDPLPVRLDVDWWTEGSLGRAETELNEVAAALEAQLGRRDPDELARIVRNILPRLEATIRAAPGEARHRARMAQARYDLGAVVAETFKRLGFAVDAHDYAASDARGNFLVGAQGPSDSVVTVVVSQAEQPNEIKVELHSFDADQKPDFVLRQRLIALHDALQRSGVTVASLTASDGNADSALRDPRKLVEKRPAS